MSAKGFDVPLELTAVSLSMPLNPHPHPTLFFSGRYLRLKMFREDHGSWMTMFFSTILFLFIFSHIYNLFLLMAGSMK